MYFYFIINFLYLIVKRISINAQLNYAFYLNDILNWRKSSSGMAGPGRILLNNLFIELVLKRCFPHIFQIAKFLQFLLILSF